MRLKTKNIFFVQRMYLLVSSVTWVKPESLIRPSLTDAMASLRKEKLSVRELDLFTVASVLDLPLVSD